MIDRGIFVLTSREDGERFLRVLPDLCEFGLSEALILHALPSHPGPATPMTGLAHWIRLFDASIPKVELALKRGDAAKWIYELSRVRNVQLVVISAAPKGVGWDFERVTSLLRTLAVPILYLPEREPRTPIARNVFIAVKAPETLQRAGPSLRQLLNLDSLRAVHVARSGAEPKETERSGIPAEIVPQESSVAATLLQAVGERDATLLTILAGESAEVAESQRGVPVVRPLIEASEIPILIWPAEIDAT